MVCNGVSLSTSDATPVGLGLHTRNHVGRKPGGAIQEAFSDVSASLEPRVAYEVDPADVGRYGIVAWYAPDGSVVDAILAGGREALILSPSISCALVDLLASFEGSIANKDDGRLVGSNGVVPGGARDGPPVSTSLFAAQGVIGLVRETVKDTLVGICASSKSGISG